MTLFAIILGAILGAIGGSFLSAAVWRHSKGISLEGRSVCTHCKKEIPANLNLPIISWIQLRGQTACCKQPLDREDLAFEVFGLLLGASLGYASGPAGPAVVTVLLMMVIYILDRKFR